MRARRRPPRPPNGRCRSIAELIEQTGKLALRLGTAARRALDGMRAHLRAAARGLPRRGDLLALPRQRFDAVDRRLGRALLANTRAHGMRLARCASRLQPRLLEARLARTRDRLDALGRRADASLARRIAPAPRQAGARRRPAQPAADRRAHRPLRRAPRRAGTARAAVRSLAQLAAHRRHLDGCAKLLASLSYQGVLQRGYALVRDSEGRTLRSAAQIAAGQRLDIELADGHVDAQALGGGRAARGAEPQPEARPSPPPRKTTPPRGGGQGSLF